MAVFRGLWHGGAMTWLGELQALDEAVLRGAHGAPSWAVPFFVLLTVIGGGWGMIALVPFAVWQRTRMVVYWLFGAIVLNSALVSSIKALVGRARPCQALGWCAAIVVKAPEGPSFPSGHAAGAFAFAAFVSVYLPRYSPYAFLFAALVAWSRCVLGVHYPSDVLAGAALGSFVGWSVARWSQRRSAAEAAEAAPGGV